MFHWLLIAAAVATGMVIPLQPGMNAELRRHTGSPYIASLISFLGGTIILAAVVAGARLTQRQELPALGAVVSAAPWWSYLGGLIGATFVTVSVILAPQLGAALLVAGIVTGQLVGSVVIDHFGLVGFRREAVSWPRVVGVGLLIAGLVVMQFGRSPR